MVTLKKQRFTEKLPGPVVTKEMQQQVSDFAKANDATVSEVIRAALEFFLSAKFINHEQLYMKDKHEKAMPKQSAQKKAKAS